MIITGCKKNEDTTTTDESSEQMVNAGDESRISEENDELVDEVNQVALNNSRFRGPGIQPILNVIYLVPLKINDLLSDKRVIVN